MNKKRAFELVMMLLAGVIFSGTATASHHGCPGPTPRLSIDVSKLEFEEKKPICVTVPGSFEIEIKVLPSSPIVIAPGDVVVKEKDPAGPEISGTNGADEIFTVEVKPGGGSTDPEFGFFIEVEGIGMLDPRVRIVETEVLIKLDLLEAIDAHLQEVFNMTLDETMALHRTIIEP